MKLIEKMARDYYKKSFGVDMPDTTTHLSSWFSGFYAAREMVAAQCHKFTHSGYNDEWAANKIRSIGEEEV